MGELRFPHARRQFDDLARRVFADTLQYIDQVGVRIDALQPASDQQALDETDALGTDFGPSEQPVLLAQWNGAQTTLEVTEPLEFARQGRLPLFTNPTSDPGQLDDEAALRLVSELDRRGIAVVCSWSPGDREQSLARALPRVRPGGLLVLDNSDRDRYAAAIAELDHLPRRDFRGIVPGTVRISRTSVWQL